MHKFTWNKFGSHGWECVVPIGLMVGVFYLTVTKWERTPKSIYCCRLQHDNCEGKEWTMFSLTGAKASLENEFMEQVKEFMNEWKNFAKRMK